MLEQFIHWLEKHLQPCFYKEYFGIECPGCGMQRSFIELLKGHLIESLLLYPALIPTFFLLVYLVLHLKFQFKNGAIILKITFFFIVLLTLSNYIYKLVTL
jgi:Protein of unknown function (DUF2752)